MSLVSDHATVITTEVNAVTGTNVVSTDIISEILAALMSILTTCIPAASVADRVAEPGLLINLVVKRKCEQFAPGVDTELLSAAVLDEAQSLTPAQWVQAYAEAKPA
jgi:hypothetical protein